MTDLTPHTPTPHTDLEAQMQYAKVVSSANMLPQAYRGKPADIMLAIGLGQAMGLSPAEALYRIDVIQGQPTASAELIASNVRRAGHTLRVRVDEANTSVTATVIRRDDPGYEHTVTRDMAWAQRMGLANRDQYKKQALTMLQWRAITAVARLAASECLYGVGHTADELADGTTGGAPQGAQGAVTAASFTAAGNAPQEAPNGPQDADTAPAGGDSAAPTTTTDAADAADDEVPAQAEELPVDAPDPRYWRKRLFATLEQRNITDADEQRQGIAHIVGRDITSRAEVTEDDAKTVVYHLEATAAPQDGGQA